MYINRKLLSETEKLAKSMNMFGDAMCLSLPFGTAQQKECLVDFSQLLGLIITG